MRRRFLPLLCVGLLLACSDSSDPGPDAPALTLAEVEGNYKIGMDLSSSSLSCHWTNVALNIDAIDSTSVEVLFAGGLGRCQGHDLDGINLAFTGREPAMTLRTDRRIRLVSNSDADTLSGTVSEDGQTITGRVVMRGTVASDGYNFTMRGTWTAARDNAP